MLAFTPILIGASVRTHFDALPIAIALGALLAFARDRTSLGFALLGLGTMTKLFPGLLAVVAFVWLFWGRDERRAALRGAAIFTAVVLAISLPFAGAGYVESFTFHLDRPVQIESTPATVLFALGGSDVTGTNLRPDRFKSNGLDGGYADGVERLFFLLLVGALAAIVALAARRPDARHLVLCGFAALLAFVTLGKVFSPQYVIWLAPFAALAWVWRERAVALARRRRDRPDARRVPEPLLRPHQPAARGDLDRRGPQRPAARRAGRARHEARVAVRAGALDE